MSTEAVSLVMAELGVEYLYLKHRVADGCWFDVFHFVHFGETLSSRLFFPPREALRNEDKLVNCDKQRPTEEAVCELPRLNHVLVIQK